MEEVLVYRITNRLFQKKFKQGRGREGGEGIEFPGVLKKQNVEIPGVLNKIIGISKGDQENIV